MHRRRSEGSAGPIAQPLTEGQVPVGSQVLARAAARRAPLTGAQPFVAEDVLDLATAVLRPDPPQETRHSYLATDGTETVGVITGIITRLTPEDEAYTYLPPRHLLIPLSGWTAEGQVARTLPALAGAAQALSREEGLDRCTVQVLPGDTEALSVWSALGWRADTHMAFRPTALEAPPAADGVTVRPPTQDDLEVLVDLHLEEMDHHVHHTGSGMAADQRRETVRAICRRMLEAGDGPHDTHTWLAEADGDPLGVLTAHVMTLPPSLGTLVLPARYGYIGLTSVTARARGRGVGRTLVNVGLRWLQGLGEQSPALTGLHYVHDNRLSNPFWTRLGFVPALTHLTDAPGGSRLPVT